MVDHNVVLLLYRNTIALFCAASIAISPVGSGGPPRDDKVKMVTYHQRYTLWQYLRTGLNYLEASGKEVPTFYRHPGGLAYGPLALTPVAVKDVKRHYRSLSGYRFEDVLTDKDLYEIFAVAYADLLLRYYIKIDYPNMPKEEVFEILQKAWFLGPGLYVKGQPVIRSRETKAMEYINCNTFIDSPSFII